jgi:hypothetical protein
MEEKKEKQTSSEVVKGLIDKISDEETIEKGKALIKNKKFEVAFGIVLVMGFLMSILFPSKVYGGAIVGLFGGAILSREFVHAIGGLVRCYYEDKVFKSFTVGILILTCLIAMPHLIVSAALGIGIRWILQPKKHCLCIDKTKCCKGKKK